MNGPPCYNVSYYCYNSVWPYLSILCFMWYAGCVLWIEIKQAIGDQSVWHHNG